MPDATRTSSKLSRRTGTTVDRQPAANGRSGTSRPARPVTVRGPSMPNPTEAKDIFNPAKQPAGAADAGCLSCHLNKPTPVGRTQRRPRAQTPSPAYPATRFTASPSATRSNCTSCHGNNWAQFNQPMGHKLGKNADVVASTAIIRTAASRDSVPHLPARCKAYAANEPGCFKCHSELCAARSPSSTRRYISTVARPATDGAQLGEPVHAEPQRGPLHLPRVPLEPARASRSRPCRSGSCLAACRRASTT